LIRQAPPRPQRATRKTNADRRESAVFWLKKAGWSIDVADCALSEARNWAEGIVIQRLPDQFGKHIAE